VAVVESCEEDGFSYLLELFDDIAVLAIRHL
jgi:hypothetical protein